MMMASIPGAPLPDTLPSDTLLCVAKESRGAATTSGLWVGVDRCYSQHGSGDAAKAERLLVAEALLE
jgi:hypothetical protein